MRRDLKVSDITILSRAEVPFTRSEQPSTNTITFLHTLFENEYFQNLYIYLREECITQQVGVEYLIYDIDKETEDINELEENIHVHFDQLSKVYDFYKLNKGDINEIVYTFDLPTSMSYNFFLLLAFNAFIDLTEPEYPEILWLEQPTQVLDQYKDAEENEYNFSAITFKHQVTKQQLKNWIDQNWHYIEKEMAYLPQNPLFDSRIHDIKLVSRVYDLHKQGRNNTEIIETLLNEVTESDYDSLVDKITDDWINNKKSRFQKILNRINKQLDQVASESLEESF